MNTYYTYDALSRLLSVVHQLGATLTVFGTLDGETYPTTRQATCLTKSDLQAGMNYWYSYDNIYQLLQVMQQGNPPPFVEYRPPVSCNIRPCPPTETYTYDLVGNRLSSLNLSPYTYNSSNELLSTPSGSYTYDKDGEKRDPPRRHRNSAGRREPPVAGRTARQRRNGDLQIRSLRPAHSEVRTLGDD